MNRELVEAYAVGGAQPAAAIAGLSADRLDAFPVPGAWSIRQIVLHLMDSDLIASDRMKRVIAEENPAIIAYNETAFAKNLFYNQLDALAACEIFRLNRLLTADILRRLPDAAFARAGMHSECGRVTLGDLVQTYVDHLAHHLKFVEQKRAMVEKGVR